MWSTRIQIEQKLNVGKPNVDGRTWQVGRAAAGTMQTLLLRCKSLRVTGLRQRVNGLRQCVSGFQQRVSGFRQHVRGLRLCESELRQHVSAFTQRVGGCRCM